MRALVPSIVSAALCLSPARDVRAEATSRAEPETDRYSLWVHGETHAELFRRALLPGAYGAIATTETLLPVYEYVELAARDLNIAKRRTGVDMELGAWWRGELGATSSERPTDGDVQTANVGYHHGPLCLRLGRQHVAGGAARFARFDGLATDVELGSGFEARVYAGLTVLPRWNQRPGFTYLGAAADSSLKDPAVSSGTRERGDYWLGGARLGWTARNVRAGLSLHEQHEAGGVSRRTLTLDSSLELSRTLAAGASASAELSAERISEARAWLDAAPAPELDLALEWLHTEPALFLSRQSVLSVFSAADYDEGGARAVLRASGQISVEGGAWAELYSGSRPGARAECSLRVLANRARTTLIRLTYARVLTPDNGYHSLRSALTERLLNRLSGTLEAYAYFYDRAIHAYRASTVYSGTLEYRPSGALSVLLGASLLRSPFANLDAQTQVRLAYDFDFRTLRGAR
jgi:hypothetical protein